MLIMVITFPFFTCLKAQVAPIDFSQEPVTLILGDELHQVHHQVPLNSATEHTNL